MILKISNFPYTLPVSFIVLLIFLTGCADRQWQDPLKENEEKSMRDIVRQEQQKREACTCCIDAEISASWDSQLNDGGLNGYLQVLLPSSIKVVAINPLGQPLYALTTDGSSFQAINAVKGVYKYGKLSSFVERHSIPENVFHGEWAYWFTGAMIFSEDQLMELRQDETSRGIWLNIKKSEKNKFSREYLLFEPVKRQLLERVVIDKNDDEAVRIIYNKWENINSCPIPTSIEVKGISYGTDIQVELRDILNEQQFSKNNFKLKLPPGYIQQFYP